MEARTLTGSDTYTMKLFLDMDGVLADFDSAQSSALEAMRSMGASEKEVRDEKFRMLIRPGFFRNLPVMAGARELVRGVTGIIGSRPHILSSPMSLRGRPEVRERCVSEKQEWLQKNFPGMFDETVFEKEKHLYASPGTILIDDRVDNTDRFTEAGGMGLLYTGDVTDALEKLRDISGGHLQESHIRFFVHSFVKMIMSP